MPKFLLMGLPGTGKTITLHECVKHLKKQGIDCNFISTDDLINKRIKADDIVIKQYQIDNQLFIAADIFTADDPSRAFIKKYGEAAFRLLEEKLLIDIIANAHENDWLDFGGRALLYEGVIKATKAKKIIPIFLYANHETIIERLRKNDGWQQRPTYKLAAEKSTDGKGWIENAELHRKERLAKHIENAAIIISVEKTSSDVLTSYDEEKQTTTLKSSEEIVKEIFMRVKELSLASSNNPSQLSNENMKFFENKSHEKSGDKKQMQETKDWLEKNLKFCKIKPQSN